MKNPEQLQEGWVKFIRFYFSEGFIDRWMGDCINDPNRPNKHQLQLNSFATYYRLNGTGDWINSRDMFKIGHHMQLVDLPAQMIWDNCYTDYQKLIMANES